MLRGHRDWRQPARPPGTQPVLSEGCTCLTFPRAALWACAGGSGQWSCSGGLGCLSSVYPPPGTWHYLIIPPASCQHAVPSAPGTAQRGRNPCLCSEGEASTRHTCYGKVGKQEGCLSSHVVPRGLPFCDTEPGILGGGGHRVPNLDRGLSPFASSYTHRAQDRAG